MADVINTGISDEAYNDYLLKCKKFNITPSTKEKLDQEGRGSVQISAQKDEGSEMEMKTCKQCSTEKPIDEYYVNRTLKDGRENICKACKKAKANKQTAVSKQKVDVAEPVKYIKLSKAKALVKEAYELGYKEAREEIKESDVTLKDLLGFDS